MTQIQGKSILVRVSARFELSGFDCIFLSPTHKKDWIFLYVLFTDFCPGNHPYKAAKNKNKGAEKGTFKFVNFPLTQADDYVAIFIVRVNV